MMRIGHGYDVHACGTGDAVVLGGVQIPWERGLIAHSDGDVVLHALCDALLGAAGLGDIGRHFPDTDPAFSDADSRTLVRAVVAQLDEAGWTVVNVDLTVIAQTPRLSEHIDGMRERIAADLRVVVGRVNVKATTTEKLGFVGREEGIASHAVALLTNESASA
tara:strand:- start:1147 stop:1635 length:489 start_codon:yes stop_codon:yes gene_type:complete